MLFGLLSDRFLRCFVIDFRFGAHPCNEEQGDTNACKQEITMSSGNKSVYPEGKSS